MVDRLPLRRITAEEARELAAAHFRVDLSRIGVATELAWGGWALSFREPAPIGPGEIFVCGRGVVHATGSAEWARAHHLYNHGPDVPFVAPEVPRRPWWRRGLLGFW